MNITIKKIPYNYIRNLFKTNELFKDDYVDSIDKIVNKVRKHKLNLLKNWHFILDNDSDTKEFNDVVNNISVDNPLSVTDTNTSTIDNTTSTTSH